MTARQSAPEVTDDAALGGRLRLLQPRRGHRFGHDGVLLAAAAPAAAGDHVVDLGAGVGLAGLAVAVRVPQVTVTLVERDPDLAALAAENIRRNRLEARARAVLLDVSAPARAWSAAALGPGSAQGVIMNPPFNDPARQNVSPDPARARAHAAAGGLEAWCRAARRLLAPDGVLTLIWRAEALEHVLAALSRGFGAVSVLPVHPRPDAAAIRVLVSARKGSRGPLRMLPGLVLSDSEGRPTAAAEAVLRGAGSLALALP
ncbi:MAG: methyltransferase [Variibacter sp.]|nr:methyltransferase [Variibacter sp.]